MASHQTKRPRRGDARQLAGEWLRDIVVEDWGLLLLAAVITLGLWYAVTAQRAPATVLRRGITLEFALPPNVEIANDPVNRVDVRLEGSQSRLDEIDPRDLTARADVTALRPGERVVRLSSKNVSMELPEGVRLVDLAPRSVTLRLEPVVEKEVPVEVHFEGGLPEGFEVRDVRVTPSTVRVRGPESHVRVVEKIHTETISLEGQRESFPYPQAAVDIPDQKVVPLEPSVAVRVEIAEQTVERRFEGVVVRSAAGGPVSPQTVSVTLRGPRSIFEALKTEEIRIVVEVGEDGRPAPRLALPPPAVGRVELVSTSPSNFNLGR